MKSLFFQPKSHIVFIFKVFILINNQLLSTANAKVINTDYSITNSTFKISWIYSVDVGKETRNKIRGFEPGIFLMNFFVY